MISPSDVGKRVTLQFYDDEGARREAVGVFERAEFVDGVAILFVRKKDDTLLRVPLPRVKFGRVVGARSGR